jgi:hypothetical protein
MTILYLGVYPVGDVGALLQRYRHVRGHLDLEPDRIVIAPTRRGNLLTRFFHFTDWELLRSCPVPALYH